MRPSLPICCTQVTLPWIRFKTLWLSLHAPADDNGKVRWSHDLMQQAVSPMSFSHEQVVSLLRRVTCPTMLTIGTNGWPSELEKVRQLLTCREQPTHCLQMTCVRGYKGSLLLCVRIDPRLVCQ